MLQQWFGPTHASEIDFVFGKPLLSSLRSNYTYDEVCLSQQMMDYWTNFAAYSKVFSFFFNCLFDIKINFFLLFRKDDPNGARMSKTWPLYEFTSSTTSDAQRAYLILETNSAQIGYNLNVDQCNFWNNIVPASANYTQYIFN
jgi:hypothetical protein